VKGLAAAGAYINPYLRRKKMTGSSLLPRAAWEHCSSRLVPYDEIGMQAPP